MVGKLAHRLTKPPQAPRDMTGYDSVDDFMNNKTAKFTALWQRDKDLLDDLQALIRELYDDASIEAKSFENPSNDDIN